MLTRLLPDQISKFWPIIKYAVEESLPPTVGEHPNKMNKILSSALSGTLGVWALYERGEQVKFQAILVTKIIFDDTSGTKSLLLYCLYGYEEITKGSWNNAFESLVKYAKSRNCIRMVAYSEIPHIINMANSFGAETDYTFISFDLNKIV